MNTAGVCLLLFWDIPSVGVFPVISHEFRVYLYRTPISVHGVVIVNCVTCPTHTLKTVSQHSMN